MVYVILMAMFSKILVFFVEIGPKVFISEIDYGKYAYFSAQLVLLASLMSFGAQNIIVKEFSAGKDSYKTFIHSFYVTIFIFIFILCFYFYFNWAVAVVFCGFMLSTILNNSTYYRCKSQTCLWYFFKDFSRAILFIFFFLIGFFLIFKKESGFDVAVFSLFFSLSFSSLLVSWRFIKKMVFDKGFVGFFDYFNIVKSRVVLSAPVIFVGFTYLALSRLDSFFIKEMMGYESLGDYSGISRIMYQSLFIQQVLLAKNLHKISYKFKRDLPAAIELSKKLRFKMVVSTSVIALFLCFLFNFNFFLDLLNFKSGKDVFYISLIFALGHISVGIFGLYGYLLLYANKQHYGYFNSLVIFVSAAVMHYCLIPILGLIGAAVSTSVAILLGNILEFYEFKYVVFPKLNRKRNEML